MSINDPAALGGIEATSPQGARFLAQANSSVNLNSSADFAGGFEG